jgi:RNA polymerase sigma-70 factor (ECF subfamily)
MTTVVATTADATQQLEALYRQDGDRLWRALLAFSGDPEVASDAMAEAYVQLMRRGDAVRDPQAWVWRASFRIAAGELKRRSTTTDRIPDVGYLHQEVDTELVDALARLPDKQRAAVVLFYYADASLRDIAQRTGMSPLSVRVNLSRGRKRLKELLGDDHG